MIFKLRAQGLADVDFEPRSGRVSPLSAVGDVERTAGASKLGARLIRVSIWSMRSLLRSGWPPPRSLTFEKAFGVGGAGAAAPSFAAPYSSVP